MSSEKQFREGGPRLPLSGKTVMVTRAQAQATEMTAALEALGAKVIHCPTIEVAPPDSWDPLDAALKDFAQYDWLVFTSANGVDFFFQRMRDTGRGDSAVISKLGICVIGPATARAIEAEGFAPAVIAPESRAEGALAAIIEYLGGMERVRGLNFLIPRARVARDLLPDGLRNLGARVDAVEAYQTIKPQIQRESLIRLFRETTIDGITFTSSSTVSNLAALLGLEDLSDLLAHTTAFCIGPVTAETAAFHRIQRIVQPQEYNSSALLNEILKTLRCG
jgi:uroporphyrinogen III methyltransferase/synthase